MRTLGKHMALRDVIILNVLFNTFKMNIVKRYPSRSRLLKGCTAPGVDRQWTNKSRTPSVDRIAEGLIV